MGLCWSALLPRVGLSFGHLCVDRLMPRRVCVLAVDDAVGRSHVKAERVSPCLDVFKYEPWCAAMYCRSIIRTFACICVWMHFVCGLVGLVA